ncbi:MAG: hypothetical protein FWC05_05815 [Treponema sp.]|nr:hypothetical protein [Treponema sp.]
MVPKIIMRTIGSFFIKVSHSGTSIVLIFVLFCCIVIFSNCNRQTEDNIVLTITEEILEEFIENDKAALKKYKNKTLQTSDEIFEIAVPRHRGANKNESSISLRRNQFSFIFNFNQDVTKNYLLNNNDEIIIQGILTNCKKRSIVEKNYQNNVDSWIETDRCFLEFRQSEIISIK